MVRLCTIWCGDRDRIMPRIANGSFGAVSVRCLRVENPQPHSRSKRTLQKTVGVVIYIRVAYVDPYRDS